MASLPLCLGCHHNLLPLLEASGENDFHKCSSCGWPLCSEACQSSPAHRDECQLLSSRGYRPRVIFNRVDPARKESAYCAIVPLRALLLKRAQPQKYAIIRTLESHIETRLQSPLYAVVKSNLVPFVRQILGLHQEVSEQELLELAGILDTNCFEIRQPDGRLKIRALYELGSMMSHSCRPNTKHFFDTEFRLLMVATVDIAKDEVISISYTQPLMSTIQRRYAIKQAKCFECCCERCRDPTEFGTYTGSIICPHCTRGRVISANPLDFRSDWLCDNGKCSFRESAHQSLERTESLRGAITGLPKTRPQEYEAFLLEHLSSLPAGNTNMLQVKYALTQLYGGAEVQGLRLSELAESQLKRKIELCRELLDVASQLEPGLSVFRAKLLEALAETLTEWRSRLGPDQFDSENVGKLLLPGAAVNHRPQQKQRAKAPKGCKSEPPSTPVDKRTMAEYLTWVQSEINEINKSDPTRTTTKLSSS